MTDRHVAGDPALGAPAAVVVTRVAVRRRADGSPPDDDWVRQRVRLLRHVGYQGLRRNGPGIAWVLLADPDRRDLVESLVDGMHLEGGSIQVAGAVGFAPTTDEIELAAPVHPGHEVVVTMRLDSDDALLPGVVASVAAIARSAPDGTLIDLPRGYQVDVADGRVSESFARRHRQGPFLALVHRTRATMLDTGGEHTAARGDREVRRVDAPSWIQTIHGANRSNSFVDNATATRLVRALRAIPSRNVAAALVNGRPVAPSRVAAVLGGAGIDLDALAPSC